VLYSFTGKADGDRPYAGVIMDSAGNLYGAASSGGMAGAGVLFKLDPTGHYTVLYSFPGVDGSNPQAGVIQDSTGNLYGTTYNGAAGAGVVFKLDTLGNETVLYSFPGSDGDRPFAGVIQDSTGNLYGTTYYGGAAGAGVVFKLDTLGNETVLYNFTGGADGANPYAGVILDSSGNLYGTTQSGGAFGRGVVFKLDTNGNETVLYSFTGGNDGGYPAGVIMDRAGNLYGTTGRGGTGGAGVVFKLDTIGNETVLYSFTGGNDGGVPFAGVIMDRAGNLYGTTEFGGTGGAGVVFKLDTIGNETVLHSFTGGFGGGNDGAYPIASVTQDSAGNLYGTTSFGGAGGAGVVFKLDTIGNETVLYSFTGGNDGGVPASCVIRDAAGNLYGTTSGGGKAGAGVVFKVTTQ
jgi:uncharacterized repeat protein (TIGR03803 family)